MFAASARVLGQQFLSKQKNTDEAGHKDTPIKDQVINWCAARVAAKDDKGRKHADEYAQFLKSVHGRPFNLVFCLSSLSADTCRLIAAYAMSGWHTSRTNLTIVKHASALRR